MRRESPNASLNELLTDLLDLSKPGAGVGRPKVGDFPLADALISGHACFLPRPPCRRPPAKATVVAARVQPHAWQGRRVCASFGATAHGLKHCRPGTPLAAAFANRVGSDCRADRLKQRLPADILGAPSAARPSDTAS